MKMMVVMMMKRRNMRKIIIMMMMNTDDYDKMMRIVGMIRRISSWRKIRMVMMGGVGRL